MSCRLVNLELQNKFGPKVWGALNAVLDKAVTETEVSGRHGIRGDAGRMAWWWCSTLRGIVAMRGRVASVRRCRAGLGLSDTGGLTNGNVAPSSSNARF